MVIPLALGWAGSSKGVVAQTYLLRKGCFCPKVSYQDMSGWLYNRQMISSAIGQAYIICICLNCLGLPICFGFLHYICYVTWLCATCSTCTVFVYYLSVLLVFVQLRDPSCWCQCMLRAVLDEMNWWCDCMMMMIFEWDNLSPLGRRSDVISLAPGEGMMYWYRVVEAKQLVMVLLMILSLIRGRVSELGNMCNMN